MRTRTIAAATMLIGVQGRFPPPWSIDDNGACFIVKDRNRTALAFVYYDDDPGRRTDAGMLTRADARNIAANIAKLPELLRSLTRAKPSAPGFN